MDNQNSDFMAAYGAAMLYAHLIEDLIEIHLCECGYFRVNNYSGLTRSEIAGLKSEERIDELSKIYAGQKDGSIERLVPSLHMLRKIRNKLTHAFVPEVGSDLKGEEGLDQIIAMLHEFANWERLYLNILKKAHEAVLRGAIKHSLSEVLNREDPVFNARVARSKIRVLLETLRAQFPA